MTLRAALLALAALVPLALSGQAHAGAVSSCPDLIPSPIAAASDAGASCQKAIAREGAKFAKTKTSVLAKCRLGSAPGACPSEEDAGKVEQAAVAAAGQIAKACGDDARQQGLGSSYQQLTDDGAISSCMLSQHNAALDILIGEAIGVDAQPFPLPGIDQKARSKCIAEAARSGIAYALGALSAFSRCLDKQTAQGTAGDLAPVCIGRYEGTFVPPTDAKTAAKLDKLASGLASKLAKKCGGGDGSWLPSVFACGGASTAADLALCLRCGGFQRAVELAEQEYGETGTLVTPGADDAIAAALAAATPPAKLLLASGDYPEQVSLAKSQISIVGCGGATGARPRLVRPEGAGPFGNGISASGQDDLHFESFEVVNWDDNGIFVQTASNVSFRDMIGDGMRNSTYALFPKESTNVTVEGCTVRNVADAGIYVGQTHGALVRHNHVEGNVAGIEIENSTGAFVHDNYATNNAGGLLVFKLPGLPLQESSGHHVTHNVSEANNGENYATGGSVSAVPVGTGMIVLSNDDGVFDYNLSRNNDTFGIAVIDQIVANAFGGDFFNPTSPDQKTERNRVENNVFQGNGSNPDGNIGSDIVFVLGESRSGMPPVEDHGNCFRGNVTDLGETSGFAANLTSQCD